MGVSLFYRMLAGLTRLLGAPIFIIISHFIAIGFFCFFPRRAAASVRFYRRLFPDRPGYHHIGLAFRQYLNFTFVFLDRLMASDNAPFSYSAEGWHYLEELIRRQAGALILMSHVGNWEVAARLMKQRQPAVRLLLYMGVKPNEQIERIQKEKVSQAGIRVVGVRQNAAGSPLELMEALHFLKSGGLVSMTGDVMQRPEQRKIAVSFLGQTVDLPEAPHALALVSGAPLLIFFAFRTNSGGYRFSISPPYYVRAENRAQRHQAIAKSAQHYADLLESAVRRHPAQWYHFSDSIIK